MTSTERHQAELDDPEFVRVPGLYRDWEIPQLVEPRCILRVEEAGEAEDGTPLFAVYRMEPDRYVVP
jgi:hypothetical protein